MKNKTWIFLIIILAIAAFFRLWQLDLIPTGLYPDVAINGNDALNSLKSGDFKVFYPENNGREGLFIWLIALSFSIFGVSVWSIKIVAAIIGILTILGLYLLIKELFSIQTFQRSNNPTIVALLSSFFLAISFWHTDFSRIGFRAILLPFILVFAFYFLFRGFRQKKIFDFVISGVFFGLGFYTYISYRFIVLLLPLILFCWYLTYRKEKQGKSFLKFTVYCLLFTVIVALPIGIYFLQHPQDFIGRAAPISIFTTENPIKEFGKSLILHLGMFNFHGDNNWRHNFSGSPMLFWPIGILFLIGFFLAIKNSLKFRQNLQFAICNLQLLSWFFIMLLPGVLTYEGIPHALRVIGVIPVVYIFAGIGGSQCYQWLKNIIKNEKLLISLSLLFLICTGFAQFREYFFCWARNSEVEGAFSKNYAEIGNYLNLLPKEVEKYVIVNRPGVPVPLPDGIPMPAQTPMFIERAKYGNLRAAYLLPEDLEKIKIEKEGEILLMGYDENLIGELSQKFPQGRIITEDNIFRYEIR